MSRDAGIPGRHIGVALAVFSAASMVLLLACGGSGPSVESQELYLTADQYRLAGDLVTAVDAYTAAIADSPEYAEAYLARADTLTDLVRRSEALLDYAKALELDETLALDVYVNRGVAYPVADEIQRAIKDFDRALLIEPDDPTALANRGLAKARSGTLFEGLIDLDAAIAIAQRNFFFGFMTRGLVRALAVQLEGSLEDYGRANKIRPDRVEPLFQRALVQLQTGMPGQALEDLDQAISILSTGYRTLLTFRR